MYVGEFSTVVVHPETGINDEVVESPVSKITDFIPGLGHISSFTHDPRRDELTDLWYALNFNFTLFLH